MVVGDIEDEHDDDERPDDRARRRGRLPRRRARRPRRRLARRSAPTSPAARTARTSTPSAGWSSACSAAMPVRGELIAAPGRLRVRDPRRRSAPRQAPAHPAEADRAAARAAPQAASGRGRARTTTPLDRRRPLPPLDRSGGRPFCRAMERNRRPHHPCSGAGAGSRSPLGAGALSALALAPFNLFPLLFADRSGLRLADRRRDARRATRRWSRRLLPAAAVGWCFGFGYFLGGLWWIGAAFLVDADQFAWLMPLAVVVAAGRPRAVLGARRRRSRALFWTDGWPRILVFAAAMAAAEWLRGHVLTGFPWNAFGYALTPAPVMMQSAALVGLWGLTLAAFVIFAAPAALAADAGRRRARRAGLRRPCRGAPRRPMLGYRRAPPRRRRRAGVAGRAIRIVQPAIDAEREVAGRERGRDRQALPGAEPTATSPDRPGVDGVTHLIWPESAFPFLLTDRPEALAAIADAPARRAPR